MTNLTRANIARLNMLIEITNGSDCGLEKDILFGLAINADDLESFLSAIMQLAKERFGALSYSDLLDIDTDDVVLDNAFRYYLNQNTSKMFAEANKILKEQQKD